MQYKLVGVGPDGPIMVRNYQAPHANEGTPKRMHRSRKDWDAMSSTLFRMRPLLKGLRP